jgi:hypothetical protein
VEKGKYPFGKMAKCEPRHKDARDRGTGRRELEVRGRWDQGGLRSLASFLREMRSQELVAHACNPRYSGGRDQEDHSSKPNSSRDPILKNPSQKRSGEVAQGGGSDFKHQYHKKKKKILM